MKILVAGDSYTDPDFISAYVGKIDWPLWGEIVAKELNAKIHYAAKMGKSNEWMINETTRMIHKEKYDVVIMALTQWERITDMWGNNINLTLLLADKETWKMAEGYAEPTTTLYKDKSFLVLNYSEIVNKNLTLLHHLITSCVYTNTKLAVFQLLNSVWKYKDGGLRIKKALFEPKNMDLFMQIQTMLKKHSDTITFDGWPFIEIIGGSEFSKENLCNLKIGNGDGHPNKFGQEAIAEYVLNEILSDVYKE